MSTVTEEAPTRLMPAAVPPDPTWARQVRVMAGLSQADLARRIGVSRLSVGRWESGKTVPSELLLWRYVRVLARLSEGHMP